VEYLKQRSATLSSLTRDRYRAGRPRRVAHKSLVGTAGLIKRASDTILSLSAIVVLSPVFVVIAAIIKLNDRGPVFYRQVRVGLGGRYFRIIKFRSMSNDAESQLGAIWSVPHDPRCTRVGRLLRRSGLDELPQLWNVLRGEMSLVGPRPERPEFTGEFEKEYPSYDTRHNVRCGITGYAQIHGWRGFTSLEERLRHDLYYIRHWSLLLDLKIMALTIVRGWSEDTRNGVAHDRSCLL
jgi:exopolysaccharide biosynthesis polyprenyl glycosylphosphotransferase